MRHTLLSEIEDNLSRFRREAENEGIVITRDGKPTGVLIGFMARRQLETTRAFCAASNRRGSAYERGGASEWKMSSEKTPESEDIKKLAS